MLYPQAFTDTSSQRPRFARRFRSVPTRNNKEEGNSMTSKCRRVTLRQKKVSDIDKEGTSGLSGSHIGSFEQNDTLSFGSMGFAFVFSLHERGPAAPKRG